MYLVDIKHRLPNGEEIRLRKVSPVPTLRGARAYELELREALLRRGDLPLSPGLPGAEDDDHPDAAPPAPASTRIHPQPQPQPEEVLPQPTPTPPATTPRRRSRSTRPAHAGVPQAEHPADSPTVPTLAEFLPEFMRFQASPVASRRGANKPNELREKQRVFDNHLIPAFGKIRLDRFTARMIDGYVADKTAPAGVPRRSHRKVGKPLAPATVANHLIVLRRVLSVAHRWEIIDRVPAMTTPAADNKRLDFLSFEESERFLAAAPEGQRTMLLTLLRTGLRLGELRGLRWQDLHLDRGFLRVERTLTKAGFGSPKSGKARTVELARDVRAALRGHPRTPNTEDLVFCRSGGHPLAEQWVYRVVQRAARDGGIGRPVHPHMLRHTFASHCVMRGIPLTAVKEWLGHAEIRMTERYAHLAPEVRSELIDRLSTGSGGNASDDRPAGRGNLRATPLPQIRGTLSSPG